MFRFLVALGFALTSSVALGSERLGAGYENQSGNLPWVASRYSRVGSLRLAQHHHHTQFLGCVHDNHECSDRAHGYQHYFVRVDHHRCSHHPHLACYGRND